MRAPTCITSCWRDLTSYVATHRLIEDHVPFGGCCIRRLDVSWNHKELYKLLYAFIYPLYDANDFADKSYIRTNIDWINGIVEYSIQIRIPSNTPDDSTSTLDCTNFRAISAKNPFTTRSHVLSNEPFQGDVDGKAHCAEGSALPSRNSF